MVLRLFELEPDAQTIFGFDESSVPTEKQLGHNPAFLAHAKVFLAVVDKIIHMLGPDLQFLTETLEDLGRKHGRFGVKPHWFPSMGRALIGTLQEVLGDDYFTAELQHDWRVVYSALSYDMVRAQRAERH